VSFARSVRGSADGRSALDSKGDNLAPFGSVGAPIEVIDATLLARSLSSSTVVSGPTGGAIRLALYPEANVMPTGLAPVPRAALTVGSPGWHPREFAGTARPR
jgi:hypothetical protein